MPPAPPSHFRPSTLMSPSVRSPLTRSLFSRARSFCASVSTSSFRLSTSDSASRPASRLLCRVGRRGSRLTGSRFGRDVVAVRFGAAGFGVAILTVVVEISLIILRLAAMFSSRRRSNALISDAGLLTGIFTTLGEGLRGFNSF